MPDHLRKKMAEQNNTHKAEEAAARAQSELLWGEIIQAAIDEAEAGTEQSAKRRKLPANIHVVTHSHKKLARVLRIRGSRTRE